MIRRRRIIAERTSMRPPHEAGEVSVRGHGVASAGATSMRPPHEAGEVERSFDFPCPTLRYFNEAPARGGGGRTLIDASSYLDAVLQ